MRMERWVIEAKERAQSIVAKGHKRSKQQGTLTCYTCRVYTSRYCLFDDDGSTLNSVRICDKCYEECDWHVNVKEDVLDILEKNTTANVPKDIWRLLRKYLEW